MVQEMFRLRITFHQVFLFQSAVRAIRYGDMCACYNAYECDCFNPLCVQLDMVRGKGDIWRICEKFQSVVRAIRYGE